MRRSCDTLASFSIGETRFVQPAAAHSCDICIGVECCQTLSRSDCQLADIEIKLPGLQSLNHGSAPEE